jgi:DNA-binding beta-propeller fold protein YncE/mono/diheme cytochrome c family protein
MHRTILVLGSLLVLSCAANAQTAARSSYKSPLGLAVDQAGKRAFVALHTAGAVAVVDLHAGKVLAEVPVGRGPYDLALVGGKVIVTCADDDALVVVDAGSLKVLNKTHVGQAPHGLAVTPDGKHAYVACHDEQALRCIDLASGQAQSLALPGWPERVVLYGDGQSVSVLALSVLPGKAALSAIRAGPRLGLLATHWLDGITNARGLALKQGPDPRALVAHQRPRTHIPTTQVAQGWVFTNVLSGVRLSALDNPKNQSAVELVLDDPAQANADPSDVVLSADGRQAFVACAGADRVLVVRTDRMTTADQGPAGYRGPEDLAATRFYLRARLGAQANPRRLALSGDGGTLVVSNYLADSLTVIDARGLRVVRHIALGGPPPDAARRGQILFNAARLTFQGQFTCASCHPGGGADGLDWDLTRDGIGNFLNTRALHGVKDTAPYGWYSTSPSLTDRAGGTLRTLHRHEPTAAELADLAAYLQALAPPRPLPQKDGPQAIARGRALFAGKAGCARCHQGSTFQDGKTHDVGTGTPADPYERLDTPSLRGVARTAPYLHGGRAATLEEIFTRFNPRQRHGAAHRLTAAELRDLVAFLKSL